MADKTTTKIDLSRRMTADCNIYTKVEKLLIFVTLLVFPYWVTLNLVSMNFSAVQVIAALRN